METTAPIGYSDLVRVTDQLQLRGPKKGYHILENRQLGDRRVSLVLQGMVTRFPVTFALQ